MILGTKRKTQVEIFLHFETVLNLVKLEAFLPLTFPILNLTMMYQISVWRIGLDWRTMVREGDLHKNAKQSDAGLIKLELIEDRGNTSQSVALGMDFHSPP